MAIDHLPPIVTQPENSQWPVPSGKTSPQGGKESAQDSFVKSDMLLPEVYTSKGQVAQVHRKPSSLLERFQAILDTVDHQVSAFFDAISQNSEDDALSGKAADELKAYFSENPEAAKDITDGSIPDHWNAENTANRMFHIVTAGFSDEMDRENFYDTATQFVNQAYDEVHLNLGIDFPPLVSDTKEALLSGLQQFKDGVAAEDIIFAKNE